MSSSIALAGDPVTVHATVPFGFTAAAKAMPAGEYTFERDPFAGAMHVRSVKTKEVVDVPYTDPNKLNTTGPAPRAHLRK